MIEDIKTKYDKPTEAVVTAAHARLLSNNCGDQQERACTEKERTADEVLLWRDKQINDEINSAEQRFNKGGKYSITNLAILAGFFASVGGAFFTLAGPYDMPPNPGTYGSCSNNGTRLGLEDHIDLNPLNGSQSQARGDESIDAAVHIIDKSVLLQ